MERSFDSTVFTKNWQRLMDHPARPACPPAARFRQPEPRRCRGPRPQRDRGTGARTHRAAHRHAHGSTHGLRRGFDPDRRWTALGGAVQQPRARHPTLPHRALRARLHHQPIRGYRSRLRTGHAARNRAALRCIALNFLTILKQYFWPKMSIRRLRKMVARVLAQLEPIMAL